MHCLVTVDRSWRTHRQAAESEANAVQYLEMAQTLTAQVEMNTTTSSKNSEVAVEYCKNQVKLYGSDIHSYLYAHTPYTLL